mgnify:FL=1
MKLLILLLSLGLLSCGKEETIDRRTQISAEGLRLMSHGISVNADKSQFYLSKSHINKEWLLRGTYMEEPFTGAEAFAMRSRLVYFREIGGILYLFESKAGIASEEQMNEEILLASFEIKSEQADRYLFDFNEGWAQVLYAYDLKSDDSQLGSEHYGYEVDLSYVKDVSQLNGGGLQFRQVFRARYFDEEEFTFVAGAIQYALSLYQRPSDSFSPITMGEEWDQISFSSGQVLQEDGSALRYASIWNIEKPVVFHLSSGIPEKYLPAFEAGINYWNKILGRNLITIEKAPQGVSAPNYNYNMIQWLDEESMDFAFADMTVDPLSGEILNSNIFIPSYMIQSYESTDSATEQSTSKRSHAYCQRNRKRLNHKPMTQSEGLSYITSLVAHEVGHTLGLKHNFASSLETGYSNEEMFAAYDEFVKNGKLPEKQMIQSVMDYPIFQIDVLLGSLIYAGKAPFSYDTEAIKALYQSKSTEQVAKLPACHDDQLDQFRDCKQFDHGGVSFLMDYAKRYSDKAYDWLGGKDYNGDDEALDDEYMVEEYLLWAQKLVLSAVSGKSLHWSIENTLDFNSSEYWLGMFKFLDPEKVPRKREQELMRINMETLLSQIKIQEMGSLEVIFLDIFSQYQLRSLRLKNENKIEISVDGSKIQVGDFDYPNHIIESSMLLLSKERFTGVDWGHAYRSEVLRKYLDTVPKELHSLGAVSGVISENAGNLIQLKWLSIHHFILSELS